MGEDHRWKRIHGPGDNERLWRSLVDQEPLYKDFVIRAVNSGIFSGGYSDVNIVYAGRIVAFGRANGVAKTDIVLDTCAVGETLFPNIGVDLLPEIEEARATICKVAAVALTYPVPSVSTKMTEKATEFYPDAQDLPAAIRGGTHQNAVNIVMAGATELQLSDRTYGAQMLLTTAIAVLKRGTTSQKYREKIISGCQQFKLNITLNPELITNIFNTYSALIDDVVARTMHDRWLGLVPRDALRIRLMIEQCEWEGLTSYVAIRNALQGFPDFYWPTLIGDLVYALQWSKYLSAQEKIGVNAFYGFRNKLDDVSSTQYKDLATMCMVLLQRAGGESNYQQYAGKKLHIRQSAWVKFLIDTYIDQKSKALSAQEITPDMRNKVLAGLRPLHGEEAANMMTACPVEYDARRRANDDQLSVCDLSPSRFEVFISVLSVAGLISSGYTTVRILKMDAQKSDQKITGAALFKPPQQQQAGTSENLGPVASVVEDNVSMGQILTRLKDLETKVDYIYGWVRRQDAGPKNLSPYETRASKSDMVLHHREF